MHEIRRFVMRKKSHISLAGYLVRSLGMEELEKHKKAFYFGSIMPDLNPKMLAVPHEFDATFESLKALFFRILKEITDDGENERILWRRVGVAMHYLADYFTYPHDAAFKGSLKDHCMYESEMKYYLRVLVHMPEAQAILEDARGVADEIGSLNELFEYIEKMHQKYGRVVHSVSADCRQILSLCATVMIAFTEMIDMQREAETAVMCA